MSYPAVGFLIILVITFTNGLDCDQIAIEPQSNDNRIVTSLNLSYLALEDHDLLGLCNCSQRDTRISTVEILDLQGNRLSGQSLSAALECMPKVQSLFLSTNPIVQLDDTSFKTAHLLRYIDLSRTPLQHLAPGVFYPISHLLLSLILDETEVWSFPDHLFGEAGQGQWALQTLSLTGNRYLSQLPSNIFQQLTALQSINVSASAIRCWPPSSNNLYLNRSPASIPDCSTMQRRLLSLSEQDSIPTQRLMFRLNLDYATMTAQSITETTAVLITDIAHAIAADSARIVNVQLGPGLPSTTTVQLDILQGTSPTAEQAIALLQNQSVSGSSMFRTGLVTSLLDLSSSLVAVPAQVHSCSSSLYLDITEPCPDQQSDRVVSRSNVWIGAVIAGSVVVMITCCLVRFSARYRSQKRLRQALTGVINLSLEQENDVLSPPSIQLYVAPSPSFLIPHQTPTFTATKEDADQEKNTETAKPRISSTATLVKRPGLNAIRSKKMALLPTVDGVESESMPDTDADF